MYTTNPLTGRMIKVGGPTHRKLQTGGGNHTFSHQLGKDDLSIQVNGANTKDIITARAGDYIHSMPGTAFIKFHLSKWDTDALADEFQSIADSLRDM